jgi:hypothetical protein
MRFRDDDLDDGGEFKFPGDEPRIIASNIRKIGVGTKIASGSLWLRRWRYTFYNVLRHRQGDKEWVQLPGREWVDSHGNVRHAALGKFDTPELQDAFRELALVAFKRADGEP